MLERSVTLKSGIFLFILLFVALFSTAQTDSTQRMPHHHLTVNLFAGIGFGEAGGYYDYRFSKKLSIQVSYGHRFYDFHTYQENVDVYTSRVYQPQQTDIARLDFKTYFNPPEGKQFSTAYLLYRLQYWQTKAPGYTQYYGFDKQDIYHIKEIVTSIEKKNTGAGIGLGKGFEFSNHIYLDMSFVTGFAAGSKKITYPRNKSVYKSSLFMTFEFGVMLGGWF